MSGPTQNVGGQNHHVHWNIAPLQRNGTLDADQEWGAQPEAIVGTCEEMCPAVERERRSRLNDVQIFERLDQYNPSLTSPELAVKRFARTIDDTNNTPEFFRTRSALRLTMAHLRNLLDRRDVRLGLIHKFLWDRYRSVRQDLYIQGIDDEFAVEIFEEVVRFHLLSEHALCEEEASITEMEGFNSHLNMEQMNKALISLGDMYNKLAAAGRESASEPEFRAYHLLSLMGQHGKFKGDSQAFLSMLQGMRLSVQHSAPVQWVLQLQRAFSSGNFVRFFILVRQAPYLLACLAHIYFGQMRGRALHTLAEALTPKKNATTAVQLSWLMDVLMLDSEEDAQTLCSLHGFSLSRFESRSVVLLIKGAYTEPPPPIPRKRSSIIASKAPITRSMAVTTPSLLPVTGTSANDKLKQKEVNSACPDGNEQRNMADMRHEDAALGRLTPESQEQAFQHTLQHPKVASTQQQSSAMQTEPHNPTNQQLRTVDQYQAVSVLALQVPVEADYQLGDCHRQQQTVQGAGDLQNNVLPPTAEDDHQLREAQSKQAAVQLELEDKFKEQRRQFVRRLYFDKWRLTTQRLCLERCRETGRAGDLKACTVGFQKALAISTSECLLEPERSFTELAVNRVPSQVLAAGNEWADLYSFLQQEHSSMQTLYWKLVVVPLDTLQLEGSTNEAATSQHLYNWLTLQLRRGTPSTSSSGISYWEESFINHPRAHGLITSLPAVRACFSFPNNHEQLATALAGSSGIVLVVSSGATIPQVLNDQLRSLRPHLPVLMLPTADGVATSVRQQLQELGSELLQEVQIVDSQLASPAQQHCASNVHWPAYSHRALLCGLQWLATKAPRQPSLQITSLGSAVQLAFTVTNTSLQQVLTEEPCGLHAAKLVCMAVQEAVALIIHAAKHAHQSIAAAWQWPPPEMALPALQRWYDICHLQALTNILHQLNMEAADLLRVAPGCDLHSLQRAAYMLLAHFIPTAPSLVTPFDLRDFLAGRFPEFGLLLTSNATGCLNQCQKMLQAETLKRKRQPEGIIASPYRPVDFKLAATSSGSPGACRPLWQELQQALALEETETYDFDRIASMI